MPLSRLVLWPADAQSAPPTEVAGYVLKRAAAAGPFEGLQKTDGLHFGSRIADPATQTPAPGFDLLAAFPPADRGGIAGDLRTRAIDVIEDGEIALGTDVTCRVASPDAIGRRSAALVSAPVELRKLMRPPAPVAPPLAGPTPPDLRLLAQPNGIGARLLQSDDPDLTDAERSRPMAARGPSPASARPRSASTACSLGGRARRWRPGWCTTCAGRWRRTWSASAWNHI